MARKRTDTPQRIKNIPSGGRKLPDHHFKLVKVKRGIAGLGLFAGEDIKKREIIIEYVGKIIGYEEAQRDRTNEYLFEISRNRTIDGSQKSNTARYCNHACEEAANAESNIIKGHVFVRALHDIKEGEEILYDYGEEFIKEHIEPIGCKCGSQKHKSALGRADENKKPDAN